MIKLNKHGLISNRLIASEFTVGNTFVKGGGTPEELAVLSLTNEQLAALSYIVNGEGRIIPVDDDGTFDTKIGHSYCIRHTDDLTLHEAWLSNDENLYVKRYGSGQLLFFATSEKCKINDPSYIVTEVFRMAALNDFVDWSGIEHYQKWFKEIEVELTELLGSRDKFVLEIADKNMLVLHTDRLDDATLVTVDEILSRVLPQNIKIVKYNHDISIPWQDAPEGYTPVKYLEGTGSQYLQLDAVPWGYASRIKVEITHLNDKAHETPFCGSIYSSQHGKTLHFMMFVNSMSWRYGDGSWPGFGSISTGVKTTIEKDRRKNYINGVLVGTNDETTIEWENDIRLSFFCCKYNPDFNVSPTYFMHGRLYSAVGWTHDIKQFDLLPCLDPTGAPCMYDKVSKTAFYNPGSGDFLYPGKETEASTFSLRRPVMYGQLTPHGVRRLYKVPDGCTMTKDEYAVEHGFKEIVEPPMPLDGYWVPQWRETDTQVILDWIETEPPTDLETQI